MVNPRAAAITAGLVSAGLCLFTSVAHLVRPGYGVALLELMHDLHPSYVVDGGASSVLVLTVLALVDGAALGFVAAWLYNRLAR